MNLAWLIVMGVGLLATATDLWPGVLLGTALMLWLSRSRYQDGFVWFAGLPGLYHFLGIRFNYAELNPAFLQWGITTAVLALLGLAASSFYNNHRWAVAWGLPLLLLRPEGWLLALLLLAHAVWMLEREHRLSGEFGRNFSWRLNALLIGLSFMLVIALGLSALRPVGVSLPSTSSAQAPANPQAANPQPSAGTPVPKDTVVRVPPPELRPFVRVMDGLIEILFNASLFLLGLVALLVLIASWRTRSGPWFNGIRLVQMLVVAFTWGMLLFWFMLNQRGDGVGGALGQAAQGSGSPGEVVGRIIQRETSGTATVVSYIIVLLASLLIFALLALALFFILRNWNRMLEQELKATTAAKAAASSDMTSEVASNRIRLAYKRFETELSRIGLARSLWESPQEYARRLAGVQPASREGVQELIQLYQPVRYGGYALESEAERAEQLAQTLPALFSGQGEAT